MDDRQLGGLLAVLTMGAIFGIYAYHQASGLSTTREMAERAALKERQQAEAALKKLCQRVTGACEAQMQISQMKCDLVQGRQELERLLSTPTKRQGCEDLEKSLAASCPSRCEFDSASMLVFGGKMTFDPPGPKDPDGRCQLTARKPVTASGQCIPKASAESALPQ